MSRSKNFARSGAYNILAQILIFGILFAVGRESSIAGQGFWQTALIFFLILIPSAIWTLFFYLQDRIEPEPTQYVLWSFLAGMAGASLLALPFQHGIYRIEDWMYLSIGYLAFVSVAIVGGIFSVAIYAIIRYGFYPVREFDEPVDGMVYGSFAGSGFALVTSLNYLLGHPKFTLFAIGYTATTNILVYASTGALIGYFVASSKFSHATSNRRGAMALAVGMILIGAFNLLEEFILLEGFENAFGLSFGLTLLLAAIALWLAYAKMRQLTERSLHQEVAGNMKAEPLVLFLIVVLLVSGGIIKQKAGESQVFPSHDYGLSFHFPRSLSTFPSSTLSVRPVGLAQKARTIFTASPRDGGQAQFTVKLIEQAIDLTAINPFDFMESDKNASLLRETVQLAGRKALRLKYSYLDKSSVVDRAEFPNIVWVYTDIVPAGNRTFVLTLRGTPADFVRYQGAFSEIENSLVIHHN